MKYKVLSGLSYPPDKTAEPGDVVDDLPEKSIPWLLKDGHIEKLHPEKAKSSSKAKED